MFFITVLLTGSITDTVPEPEFATYIYVVPSAICSSYVLIKLEPFPTVVMVFITV